MKLSYLDVQQKLIEQIKTKTSGKIVDVLGEALSISSDSAYRRIRNEKIFTLDEILKVCTKFDLSFDEAIGDANNNTVAFSFHFKTSNYDFSEYLSTVIDHIDRVKKEGGTMYYSAKDIPVFHFFQSKELTAFKIFYWLRTMSNDNELTKQKFDFEMIPAKLREVTKKIYTSYAQVKSYEIWNHETIHSTINQITYYKDSDYISTEQASVLLHELKKLIIHLSEEAEHQFKYHIGNKAIGDEPNFNLYYNEIIAADNSIYAEYGNVKESYKPHIVLNYMITNNVQYCNYIKTVFDGVLKKSTIVSGVNEKERNQFFNYNLKRIDRAIKKLDVDDDDY